MNVLVLNAGSATLKFQLIATDRAAIEREDDVKLARGLVERIGGHALITFQREGGPRVFREKTLRDHRAALAEFLSWVVSEESGVSAVRSPADIHAVGHRVVHGGQRFRESVRVDAEVIAAIEDMFELAPLHNPGNLKGVHAATELLGAGMPQVAVFDTAFHASMPETSYLYAIPYSHYRRFGLRKYGFHGSSHRYIAYRYRKLRGLPKESVNIITLHLGNGCSACAIREGRSFDTSMGFTPLEGLVMGTRAGDVDASLVAWLAEKEGLSVADVESMLNKQSGLLGISGLTSDMRELLAEEAENGDRRARLAIEIFCQRVRKYIGAYFAELGGADAIVFSGGIGENSAAIRERICRGLGALGLELDATRNSHDGGARVISTDVSRLQAWVIPTDEELLIARDTARLLASPPPAAGPSSGR
ncbi:MAG: acetate kinase [Planctomycetes bacterium]|nr:acetate kinase [Planctomycetota bacterium]